MTSVTAYLDGMAELVSEDGRNFPRKPIGERRPPLGAASNEVTQESSERTSR